MPLYKYRSHTFFSLASLSLRNTPTYTPNTMRRALLLAFCWLLASALVFMAAEGRHARCTNGLRCLHGHGQQNGNPKVRAGTAGADKDEVLLKGLMKAGERGEMVVAWELRRVPSGPDPLHHNGSPPKKPQTP